MLTSDKRQKMYEDTVSGLRTLHGELIKLEEEGRLKDVNESPGIIGDYMLKLRFKCSLLFSFENELRQQYNHELKQYAAKRQLEYEKAKHDEKSDSTSVDIAREKTRNDEAEVKVTENNIKQIRNEYSRYDGIVMALQSRLNEFNAERRSGG